MRKGFIFSLDASLALIVVIMMGVMLGMYFQGTEPRGEAYSASGRTVEDAAVVGFYLGKDAAGMGLAETPPTGTDFASCSILYDYEIQAGDGMSGPTERAYCGGIG